MLTGTHFYNQTLKKSVSVFGTIFNNIRVVKHGGVEERVPIAYGPRQKFLARLEQSSSRDEHIAIKVPRMSFEITDLSYDSAISLNKMNKLSYPSTYIYINTVSFKNKRCYRSQYNNVTMNFVVDRKEYVWAYTYILYHL